MNREDIEETMQKLLKQIEDFNDEPTYEKACMLDMSISILRFMVGEQNFMPLHYFRQAHEDAVAFMDREKKRRAKEG